MAQQTTRGPQGSYRSESYGQEYAPSSPYDSPRSRGSYQREGQPYAQSGQYAQNGQYARNDAYQQAAPYAPRGAYGAGAPPANGAYSRRAVSYGTAYGNQGAAANAGGPSSGGGSHRALVTVAAVLAGVVIGLLAMFFIMNARSTVPEPVSATLSESQLDTVVGSYRYDGSTFQITAREAILGYTSLASVANSDGTYDAPSADMVLSYARNQILSELVADAGITVSNDEVAAYALSTVGTSDMATVASLYGMDEAQAQQIMAQAASVAKLRTSVTGSSAAGAPVAPELPADGNTEVGNAAYASYIIGLLGSNWDASIGSWANTDNAYYAALSNELFSSDSANYEAAQAAYAVAYNQYVSLGSGDAWADYVNSYLDKGAVSVATLRS